LVTLAPFKGNAAAATMKPGDDLLATIEAVHAAGLDEQLWPQALERVARVVGGIGCSLAPPAQRPAGAAAARLRAAVVATRRRNAPQRDDAVTA
jgi:hypothetical protein